MSQSQLSKIVSQLQRSFGFGRPEDNPIETTVQLPIVRILELTVVTVKGRIVRIVVNDTDYGRNVKIEALEKLSQITELPYFSVAGITLKMINYFKLIRVSNNKTFWDSQMLQELKVKNNEQFIMTVKRLPISEDDHIMVVSPTEEEIMKQTGHLTRSPETPSPTSPKIILDLLTIINN